MPSRLLYNRVTQVAIDLAILAAAYWLAFLLRFDGEVPRAMLARAVVLCPYVVALQYCALLAFAVPRFSWRFVGLREAERILAALLMSTLVLVFARAVAAGVEGGFAPARLAILPYGVILIDALLACLGVAGVRVTRRVVAERTETQRRVRPRLGKRTILIGAGQAGFLVAKEIRSRPDLGIEPIGFIDDDPRKLGSLVHGLPVMGSMADLPAVRDRHRIEQALITIANAPGPIIRKIARQCEVVGLRPKIIPGIYEIVGGQVNLSRIRPVTIEDLLRREEVDLDIESIEHLIRDRVVLVTGAGGSIGSELCRQIVRFSPARLVLVDQAENPLFAIDRELREKWPDLSFDPRVADVRDAARIERVFDELRPSTVFHAAAHKHVPMMEANPGEAIKNNVVGTRTVADTAHQHGVSLFVMVSTDKAVNPSSVMGASKRIAELYVQALGRRSKTRFVTVRFGNVLGSNGSVVPIFKEQIARGGPVTVTDPAMTRYFMTIPEACRLILQAGSMGQGGETFVLDMGAPVKIVDLASDLITLSGFVPNTDIPIVFTGLRPGEKLHEELSLDDERVDRTRHPKIMIGRGPGRTWEEVASSIERLEALADVSPDVLRVELSAVLSEYQNRGRNAAPGSDAYRKPTAAQS